MARAAAPPTWQNRVYSTPFQIAISKYFQGKLEVQLIIRTSLNDLVDPVPVLISATSTVPCMNRAQELKVCPRPPGASSLLPTEKEQQRTGLSIAKHIFTTVCV